VFVAAGQRAHTEGSDFWTDLLVSLSFVNYALSACVDVTIRCVAFKSQHWRSSLLCRSLSFSAFEFIIAQQYIMLRLYAGFKLLQLFVW